MLNKLITWLYYLLFFLTPFLFYKYNAELFEYNKMMFVYGVSVLVVGLGVIRAIRERKAIFQRTPLDIPLILFFFSQLISTITSIDPHTSIWGYYSRSNGGLLSVIAYLLLYWSLASHLSLFEIEKRKALVLNFLKAGIYGSFIIALWGIFEHFGYSMSCLLLTGSFNDSCWVQDVQSRVFASLGQPNWMAAYLGMLLFPTLYFALTERSKLRASVYYLIAIANYLSFTFTNSRGAAIGMVVSLLLFVVLHFGRTILVKKYNNLIPAAAILAVFVVITLFFGSGLTSRFQSLTQITPTPSKAAASSAGGSQLENGGTESGKIRLIVWQGALEIFKHYPLFGSGVETFAYSYYQYRPQAHNLVSEWDFLYNKAHNEYLNYLATTGLVGLGTYLLFITAFLVWSMKYIVYSTKQKSHYTPYSILITAILCSYIFYLIQDVVQFSVVAINVMFYLFPALSFAVVLDPERYSLVPLLKVRGDKTLNLGKTARVLLYIGTSILMISFLFILIKYWVADLHYSAASNAIDTGDAGGAYSELTSAVLENPHEPIYRSDLGFAAASVAVALKDKDATFSGTMKDLAVRETNLALNMSPRNVSLWRTAIRTDYELASLDSSFNQKTLETIDKTISLAPTDPKLVYNKALILGASGEDQKAIGTLQEALKLKPDYHDALIALSDFYAAEKEKDKAIAILQRTIRYFPGDPEATDKLNKLKGS